MNTFTAFLKTEQAVKAVQEDAFHLANRLSSGAPVSVHQVAQLRILAQKLERVLKEQDMEYVTIAHGTTLTAHSPRQLQEMVNAMPIHEGCGGVWVRYGDGLIDKCTKCREERA